MAVRTRAIKQDMDDKHAPPEYYPMNPSMRTFVACKFDVTPLRAPIASTGTWNIGHNLIVLVLVAMSKSRITFLAIATTVSVIVLAAQVSLPSLLSNHVKSLQDAQSASGTLTVQPLAGTAYTVKFKYAKPNLFRFESDSGFTDSDGKNVYTYSKETNTYTVEPVDDANVAAKTTATDLWAWSPFFNKDAYKDAITKMGSKRTVKGTKVTEVLVSWMKPRAGDATLYFDDNTGGSKASTLRSKTRSTSCLLKTWWSARIRPMPPRLLLRLLPTPRRSKPWRRQSPAIRLSKPS